jgi:DnaJ-class molecular chaperone
MFNPVNPLGNGRFGAFETNTDEGAKQALLQEWEAHCVKRDREPCPRCNGFGLRRPEDFNTGCNVCKGEGTLAAV